MVIVEQSWAATPVRRRPMLSDCRFTETIAFDHDARRPAATTAGLLFSYASPTIINDPPLGGPATFPALYLAH